MALDLDTGRMVWSKQLHPGRRVQLGVLDGAEGADVPRGKRAGLRLRIAGDSRRRRRAAASCCSPDRSPGIVWAIDPEKNGEIMWETRVAQGGINGGVQWGMAADGEQVYAATSDVVVIRTPTARAARSATGRRTDRAEDRRRQQGVAGSAAAVWRRAELQSGATRRAHRDPRRRLLWIAGRPPARALDARRIDHLGLRHRAGLQDGERRERQRRRHRRPWPRRRQRHGVRQFRLYAVRRRSRATCCWRLDSSSRRRQSAVEAGLRPALRRGSGES